MRARLSLSLIGLAVCILWVNALAVKGQRELSQPVVNICRTPGSGQKSNSTILQSWEPEPRPATFEVDLRYTEFRDLSKFNVWLDIVLNIARMGLNPWDKEMRTGIEFPVSNNIEFKARSSVNAPRYQTKSLLWTLQEIFYEYNRREQYSSATFVTRVEGVILGLGSIKSTLQSTKNGQNGDSFTDVLNSFVSPGNGIASSTASTNVSARRGFEIRLEYTPNGALLSPVDFFDTVIRFLLVATNRDPKSSTVKRAAFVNPQEGYSLEVASLYDDENISLENVIRTLGYLPIKMYEQGAGGRWAELKGIVLNDGVKIGRVRLEKGSVASEGFRVGGGLLGDGTTFYACKGSNSTLVS